VNVWDSVNQPTYYIPQTDSSGKATLMVYPPYGETEVMFQATLSKYRTAIQNMSVITGAAPTTGIIQGKVWDGYTGFEGITVQLYEGNANYMLKIMSGKEDATIYNTAETGPSGSYMFTGVEFPAGDQQAYSVCIAPHQDKRPQAYYWGSSEDFVDVTVSSTDRFKSDINIQVQANNEPTFTPRTITEGNQYDPYDNKEYEPAKLDGARYVFRTWVEDKDNDEPELVKLLIGGKEFNMKPMRYTNSKYTGADTETKLPPMNPGRYYEAVLELGDLDGGKYDYSFVVRDVWASFNTTKQSAEKIEIQDLRAVVLKDTIVNFAVQGVLALLLLIATVVAYVITKKKSYYSEYKNKDLTTYGMGHSLQNLDSAAAGDKANELNDARRQFIEGSISAEEFVRKLKG
jgi:hypothetical protein